MPADQPGHRRQENAGVRRASAVYRAQVACTGIAALLVFFVEGFDAIALWNVTPLGLAVGGLALSRGSFASRELSAGGLLFWASQVVLVVLLHVAWGLDWGATATGSSTSGLLFLFGPIYMVAAGLLLAVLVIVVTLE